MGGLASANVAGPMQRNISDQGVPTVSGADPATIQQRSYVLLQPPSLTLPLLSFPSLV